MERSDEIILVSGEDSTDTALELVDDFIDGFYLVRKNAIRFRLLAEETLGMFRALTGKYTARFWLEHEGYEFRVRLCASTVIDKNKKDGLLSVATSGRNAAAKGFMGRISEVIENGLLDFDKSLQLRQDSLDGITDFAEMGYSDTGSLSGEPGTYSWTLDNYRQELKSRDDDELSRGAWDELEKSIVASIAENVIVGVKKNNVDMTIVFIP